MNKSEVMSKLDGEVSKAVWNLIYQYKRIRRVTVRKHLQYPSGAMNDAFRVVLATGAVEMEGRDFVLSEAFKDV